MYDESIVANPGAKFATISGTATVFIGMVARRFYLLTSTVTIAFVQGTAPVATFGTGSTVQSPRISAILDGGNGPSVSVLGSAAGIATLTPITILG